MTRASKIGVAMAALAALALAACDGGSKSLAEATPAKGAELEEFSNTIHKPAKLETHGDLVQLFCHNMSGAPCPADTPEQLKAFGFTDGGTGIEMAYAFIRMAADAKDGTADKASSDPDFIAAAYRVVFAREPDADGAAHYAKFLTDKPGEAGRNDMLLMLLKSPEFKLRQ